MKILLIQFYQTGDLVLTTHIPELIKREKPDAEIHFLTFTANAPLLEGNPQIDKVITTKRKDIPAFIKLLLRIRRERYDAVLDFQDNPRSTYCTLFSRANMRITYGDTSRGKVYTHTPERKTGHAGLIKTSLLTPLLGEREYTVEDTRGKVYPPEISKIPKELGLEGRDMIVTISPTHKNDTRRWKLRHFIDTANWLAAERNAGVIFTYGPGEEDYIREGVVETEQIRIMPPLKLREFAGLLERADLHIGNDSAPHHIATAVNTPTFIIIGSTSPGWVLPSPKHTWISKGMDCQPCKKSECRISGDVPCMEELSFNDIKPALERFIDNGFSE
ncbi:glycosyltransferase family 9 protein [Limisalsivibrio acetivorans]|uniref:glycosyltransferase family 9 protein n=1 Tax=Limisalsivibrio acetivorans TaxID=1304888 RepID=UPI0003B5D169|nr:glycosyltransferase family 9 protein [Limisalsivibrio acetivorans]